MSGGTRRVPKPWPSFLGWPFFVRPGTTRTAGRSPANNTCSVTCSDSSPQIGRRRREISRRGTVLPSPAPMADFRPRQLGDLLEASYRQRAESGGPHHGIGRHQTPTVNQPAASSASSSATGAA